MNHPSEQYGLEVLETLESLYCSIQKSGGDIEFVALDKLKNMTALNLILKLAGNNIRFQYQNNANSSYEV